MYILVLGMQMIQWSQAYMEEKIVWREPLFSSQRQRNLGPNYSSKRELKQASFV